jgi:hypothetical protein
VPRADLLLTWLSPADDDDQADGEPRLTLATGHDDSDSSHVDMRDRVFELVGREEELSITL